MTEDPTKEFDNVTNEQLDKMILDIDEGIELVQAEGVESERRAREAGESYNTVPDDYFLSDLEERKDKLLAEKKRRQEKLTGHLDQLVELASQAGAEGIWIIRGSKVPSLIYNTEHSVTPIILDVEDAGVLVLMRFLNSDGGEEGVESK